MSYLPLCVGEGLLAFSKTSAFHGALPGGASGKEPTCQCRRLKRHGVDSCVGKTPGRRAWPAGKILWTEQLGRLQPIGSQRVGHDWSDLAHMHAAFHNLTGNHWSGCFFLLFCLMITSLKFSKHFLKKILSICIALVVFVLQDSSKVVYILFWYMKTSYIKHEDSFYWSFCMYEDLGSEWI